MKIKFMLLIIISIIVSNGCWQGTNLDNKHEDEMMIEAIKNGELKDSFGKKIINPERKAKIEEYLILNWKSLKYFNTSALSARGLTDTHYSPEEHEPQWNGGEIYLVRKWWYVPTRVDVYIIYICTYTGCRESEMIYQGEFEE